MKMRMTMAAALAAAVMTTPALADQPGRGWISMDKVMHMLAKRGYTVTKIEADDGHWEGEATRQGRHYEFHVDPHSGRITKMERDRD